MTDDAPQQLALPAPVEPAHVHEYQVPARNYALANAIRVGMFAVAVGVFGALIFDYHGHTCTGCGARWSHLGAFNFDDVRAHACTRCGATQWRKDP